MARRYRRKRKQRRRQRGGGPWSALGKGVKFIGRKTMKHVPKVGKYASKGAKMGLKYGIKAGVNIGTQAAINRLNKLQLDD